MMSMMSDQGFSNQFERHCAHDFKRHLLKDGSDDRPVLLLELG